MAMTCDHVIRKGSRVQPAEYLDEEGVLKNARVAPSRVLANLPYPVLLAS